MAGQSVRRLLLYVGYYCFLEFIAIDLESITSSSRAEFS